MAFQCRSSFLEFHWLRRRCQTRKHQPSRLRRPRGSIRSASRSPVGDEGGEEPIKLLDVHCLAALATLEELRETIEFGVGQRLVLGECLLSNSGACRPVYDTTFDWLPILDSRYFPLCPAWLGLVLVQPLVG